MSLSGDDTCLLCMSGEPSMFSETGGLPGSCLCLMEGPVQGSCAGHEDVRPYAGLSLAQSHLLAGSWLRDCGRRQQKFETHSKICVCVHDTAVFPR